MEVQLLSEINKHEIDKRIKFTEYGHVYCIDGNKKDIVSCTTFIHKFFSVFDTKAIIKSIQESDKYNNDKTYKYYGMSYDNIKDEWSMASKLGIKLHHNIELYYNNLEVEYEEDSEFEQFLQFQEDHEKEWDIYRTEWKICSDIFKITGCIDAVFTNNDGTISLVDWKRTKEIVYKSFNQKMGISPLDDIPDCNYYHYSLQLNLYRVILEKFYNKIVKDMFLIVLHPENLNNKYIKIPVNKMDKEINNLFEYRKKQLKIFA